MQKDIRLAVFLAAVLTLIWAAPLPASQMSLSATHNFIVTLTYDGDGTTIEPFFGASVSASTQGKALYPEESNYVADSADGNTATATASFPAMTWLQTNYSSMEYLGSPSGNSTFNWSTTLVGYGGGYLEQQGSGGFHLLFLPPFAGSYTGTVTDIYDEAVAKG